MEHNIILIGPRCVGKTNTGISLAENLDAEFIDSDPVIERATGKSINEIVRDNGWHYFRRLETNLIKKVTSNSLNKKVVFAPGGGAVSHEYADLREQNINYLKSFGKVVLLMPSESLEESARIICERMLRDSRSVIQRPSLTGSAPQEEVLEVLTKRAPFYKKVQDYVIYTEGLNEKEVARKIVYTLEGDYY